MKNIIKSYNKSWILSLLFPLLIGACTNEEEYTKGTTGVQIKLSGVTSEAAIALRSGDVPSVQTAVVDMGDGTQLIATLEPDPVLTTRATTKESLNDNTKYSLYIFNQDGSFVDKKEFTYHAGSSETLQLSVGSYKFACVSIGNEAISQSDNNPTFNDMTYSLTKNKDTNVDADLMYWYAENVQISAGVNNYIDITLMHKTSVITTVITTSTEDFSSGTGLISGITATIGKVAAGGTLTFNGGAFTPATDQYDHPVNFTISTASTSITSDPTAVCIPSEDSDITFNISSMTIDGITKKNITPVGPFKMNPGYRYTLNLLAQKGECYLEVDSVNFAWSSALTKEWSLPDNANAGFQIDIYDLDNSFNMTVNGEPLYIGSYTEGEITRNINEINFQGWNFGHYKQGDGTEDPIVTDREFAADVLDTDVVYPPNIEFADGSRWGIREEVYWPNHELNGANAIWSYSANTDIPILRIVIDETGAVGLYGRRSLDYDLQPLSLLTNFEFIVTTTTGQRTVIVDGKINPDIKWNATGGNEISISMKSFGTSRLKGKGFGRAKVVCGTEGSKPLPNIETGN